MSQAQLPERATTRRNLTEAECTIYLNQLQASLRTLRLPIGFGDGTEESYLSVQVSMTISTASQEAWAFTYRISQPMVVIPEEEAPHSPSAIAPPSPPPSPPLAALPLPPSRVLSLHPYGCKICVTDYIYHVNRIHCMSCGQIICKRCSEKCLHQRCPFCRHKNSHWAYNPEDSDEDISD